MKSENLERRFLIGCLCAVFIMISDGNGDDRPQSDRLSGKSVGVRLSGTTGDADNVELIGAWQDGKAKSVQVRRNLCYFGHGGIFEIADFSIPANPVSLGKIHLSAEIKDIFLDGSYAYVANDWRGLQIVDVSDSLNPTIVGCYPNTKPYDVVVRRNLAFIADGSFRILDVSDPANPVQIGAHGTTATAQGVAVKGDYAYIADSYEGMQVMDISDSTAPAPVILMETHYMAQKVVVLDTLAYVADMGIYTFDISDPEAPVQLDFDATGSEWIFDITIQGSYLYAANRYDGLRIYDLSTPANPVSIEVCNTPGIAYGVGVENSVCYVADSHKGIQAINATSITSTYIMGNFEAAGESRVVKSLHQYVLVANDFGGLKILDTSDPENPTEISSCETPDLAYDIAIDSPYVYIADYNAGLKVIDISDIHNPQGVGSWGSANGVNAVCFSNDRVYLVDVIHGLSIINVLDPEHPQFLGEFDQDGDDVFVEGNYAYMACGSAGLVIVDVSNPALPVECGTLDTEGGCNAIVVRDQVAYIADEGGGLLSVDVSDPYAPSLMDAEISVGWAAMDVDIFGSLAYVANYGEGLQIFDISDPDNLSHRGFYDTGDLSLSACYHNGLVCTAERSTGVMIFEYAPSLTDVEFVNGLDTYYFNESVDGHQVDMNFTSLTGSGEVTVEQMNQAPSNPVSDVYLEVVWNLSHVPEITSFTTLAAFHYNSNELSYTNQNKLQVFRWNGMAWQCLGGTVNTYLKKVTVPLSQFSNFALFAVDEVLLNLKVFLEGPYVLDYMITSLEDGGYIPTTSPYEDARTLVSIPDNIVDWVFVELRSTADGEAEASRSFFLRNDGMVTDDDGATTDLSLTGADDGSYFIVVKHRNHLAVMSATAQPLNSSSALLYDFTDSSEKYYGGETGVKELGTNWGMVSGDANANGEVQADDKESYWRIEVGLPGYKDSDFNLNGEVQADDKEYFWGSNAGRGSQVP